VFRICQVAVEAQILEVFYCERLLQCVLIMLFNEDFLLFKTQLPIIPVAQTEHDHDCDYQYFRSQANHVTPGDEYEGTRGVNV